MGKLTQEQRSAMVKEYSDQLPLDQYLFARTEAYDHGVRAGYDAGAAAERERIVAELEDIMQGGDEWRRYDEALREAVKIVKGGEE